MNNNILKTTLIYEQPQDYYDIFSYMHYDLKENASIREFVNKIESMANTYRNNVAENTINIFSCEEDKIAYINDKVNKYKGDILEIFSEIFFMQYQTDPSFGIKDYTPVSITDDYGVDATGINVNGDKVAIQVKYRANVSDRIDYESLAKTFAQAVCLSAVDSTKKHTIFLFTTAQGCDFPPEKVLGNRLVVINKSVIANKVDGNLTFWENAFNIFCDSLDKNIAQ